MNEPLGNRYIVPQLFRDCSEGNYDEVKEHIINCCNINEIGPDGETALACAINANNFEIVELLLKSGANPNSRPDKVDSTPLMDAANVGYTEIVRVLLEYGATPHTKSSTNNTALHYSACGGHVECCKLLLEYSNNPQALIEEQNENGHTALMEAATSGFLDTTTFLVHSGAQINTQSAEFKETALTLASYKGYSDIVQFLLESGADHEHRTDEMHTALMEASMEGHIEAAKVLLYYGAHVNMRTDSFESPLTLAACSGHSDLAACLISYGADIEEVNDESYTPLMEASREGHLETVAMLLSLGASINRVTEETQETAMTLAACGGFYDIVLLLHRCGADIELGASTPLMESAQEGHLEIVKVLLAMGAKVDAKNSSDETSLHFAAENGHVEVCRYLLDHTADIHHVSEGGRTCLMKACRSGNIDVVFLLIERGSRVDQMTTIGDHNALSLACANGHCKIVEYMLQVGADPTVKLKDNCSVLIEASRAGHIDVIEILLHDYKRDKRLLAIPNNASQHLYTGIGVDHDIDHDLSSLQQINNHYKTSTNNINKFINIPLDAQSSDYSPLTNIYTDPHLLPTNTSSSFHSPAFNENSPKLPFGRSLFLPTELQDQSTSIYPYQSIEEQFSLQSALPMSIFGTENDKLFPNYLDHNPPNFDDWIKYMCPNLNNNVIDPLTTTQHSSNNHVHRKIKKAKHSENFNSQVDLTMPNKGIVHPMALNIFADQSDELTSNDKFNSSAEITFDLPTRQSQPHRMLTADISDIEPDLRHVCKDCNKFHLTNAYKDSVKNTFTYPTPNNQFSTITDSSPHKPNSTVTMSTTSSSDSGVFSTQDSKDMFNSVTPTTTSPLKPIMTSTPFQKQVLQPKRRLQPNQRSSLITPSYLCPEHKIKSDKFLLPNETSLNQFNFPDKNLSNDERDLFFSEFSNEDVCQLSGLLKQKSGMMNGNNGLNSIDNLEVVKEIENEDNNNNEDDDADFESDIDIDNCAPPYKSNGCCNKLDCKKKLNVNVCTESLQESPLSLACSGGHIEVVKLLINSGAKLEHRDKKSQTALHVAVLNGHLEVVRFLLESGADMETMVDRTKDTALSIACANGKLEIIEVLVQKGANIEHRNISDYTPLSLAASGGYVDIIKFLLANNAEINSRTNSKLGISPLMLAAMNGYIDAVNVLLEHGSDINAQIETNRNTALTLACYQGRTEVVSLLIEKKAYIEHRAKSGLTPLMEAASQGHVKVGRVLIAAGADVNAPPVPASRETALIIAAEKGHTEFVRLLLHHNAAVDARNKKGDTPLWLACHGGFIDVVKLLIDSMSDPNSADNRRMTCLMDAFKKGHLKVVKELIKYATQFPSEHECVKHIKSIKNEEKDLIKRCETCKDIILKAKERQECEAAKNAKDLLKQVEEERKAKEQKEVKQAKKREKKKAKKKAKHEDKDVEVYRIDDRNTEEEVSVVSIITNSTEYTLLQPANNNENINPDNCPPVKSNKRSRTKQDSDKVQIKTHAIEETKPEKSLDNTVKKDDVTDPVSKLTTSNDSTAIVNNKSASKNSSWIQINSNKVITTNKPEEITVSSNWQKIGGNKKKLDIQVNKKDIGKVIGQGGSVVNAIRHITGAHIDIDSMANDMDERTVHLKGTIEAVTKARDFICDLVDGSVTGNTVIKESEPYLAKLNATSTNIDLEYIKPPLHTKPLPIVRQNGKLSKFGYTKFGLSSSTTSTNNLQYGFSKSNKCPDFASVAAAGIVSVSPRVKNSEKNTANDNFPSLSESNYETYQEPSKPSQQSSFINEPLEINTNVNKSFPLAPGSERSLHQRTYNSTPEHSPQLDNNNSKNEAASSGSTVTSSNSDKDEILEGTNNNLGVAYPLPMNNYVGNWTTNYQDSINNFPKLQSLNPRAEAFSPSYSFKPEDFYYNINGTLTLNPTANIFRPRQSYPMSNNVQQPATNPFVMAPTEERLIRLQDHINMAINILLRNNGFDHNMAEAAFSSFMRSANLDLNTRLTTSEFTSLINNIINQSNVPPTPVPVPPPVPPQQPQSSFLSSPVNSYPLSADNYRHPQPSAQTHWPIMTNLNSQSIWAPASLSSSSSAINATPLIPPTPPIPHNQFFPNLSQCVSAAQAAFNSPGPDQYCQTAQKLPDNNNNNNNNPGKISSISSSVI